MNFRFVKHGHHIQLTAKCIEKTERDEDGEPGSGHNLRPGRQNVRCAAVNMRSTLTIQASLPPSGKVGGGGGLTETSCPEERSPCSNVGIVFSEWVFPGLLADA